jgi:dihydrofolate reductase
MYPGYGEYWAAIEANPRSFAPFQNRLPYEREVAYAHKAAKTPHYILSNKLDSVTWPPTAKIIRSSDELRGLKEQPGKNIYVVGGPTIVTGLLNAGLLDELRLIVHPLFLAEGRALFEGVEGRRALQFVQAEPLTAGKVALTYQT